MTNTNIAPWLSASRWPTVPIRLVARLGSGHTPSRSIPEYWENCTVPWITLADVWQLRNGSVDTIYDTKEKVSPLGLANSAAVKHPVGTVILSRTASVGFSAIMGTDMATSQDFATWTCGPKINPRYLLHALRGMAPDLKRVATGSTHKTIYMPDIEKLRIPLPPVREQWRIADFLDAETGRLDRLIAIRKNQAVLLDQRLEQLINGAIAGDEEVLGKIGIVHAGAWGKGRISRLYEVVPGYAFPGSEFLTDGSGVRLLRGANVAPGCITWNDTFSWDTKKFPIPERFHLKPGDLVLGMDRPWISSGMRIAFMQEHDMPTLLLQRVACLRRKSPLAIAQYAYWVLSSSGFRFAVESELTGVSVPHLSGEQIGGFGFPLPAVEVQEKISAALTAQQATISQLKSGISRQVTLLEERRQVLITAAVTGQFDVTTASGRGVTE